MANSGNSRDLGTNWRLLGEDGEGGMIFLELLETNTTCIRGKNTSPALTLQGGAGEEYWL